MDNYRYVHPVEVRFGDLDVYGHVNHAMILTYFEIARVNYMVRLGIRPEHANMQSVSFIMAHISCDYREAIFYGQPVEVGARISRIGRSSLRVEHRIEADGNGAAEGHAIIVHYDYPTNQTKPIPDQIRANIIAYEGDHVEL